MHCQELELGFFLIRERFNLSFLDYSLLFGFDCFLQLHVMELSVSQDLLS